MTDQSAAYVALGGISAPVDKDARIAGLKVRLEVMRAWIHQVDWDLLCQALPEARDWFDENGRAT